MDGKHDRHNVVLPCAQVADLNKIMEDMKSENAFALHRKTAELMDELKQVGTDFVSLNNG